jgi:hypothetical protein
MCMQRDHPPPRSQKKYLCGEKLPRRAGWWLDPSPQALQLAFTDHSPHRMGHRSHTRTHSLSTSAFCLLLCSTFGRVDILWLPPRPCVLTQALVTPLCKGTGLSLGFGFTPRSRTLWIWASTSVVLNSLEKGRSGQLSPGYIHILVPSTGAVEFDG